MFWIPLQISPGKSVQVSGMFLWKRRTGDYISTWWESLWSFFSFCICFPNLFLQKSWKRRFFVLLKYRDNKCQLKYYKNEEKNKPLGDIDLSTYVQYLHSARFISNWTSCIISLKPVCQLPIPPTVAYQHIILSIQHHSLSWQIVLV